MEDWGLLGLNLIWLIQGWRWRQIFTFRGAIHDKGQFRSLHKNELLFVSE